MLTPRTAVRYMVYRQERDARTGALGPWPGRLVVESDRLNDARHYRNLIPQFATSAKGSYHVVEARLTEVLDERDAEGRPVAPKPEGAA